MHALRQKLIDQPDGSNGSPEPPRRPGMPPEWRDKLGNWSSRPWSPLFWYFLLVVGMLWFWQEASHQFNTRTIPYSRFKDLLGLEGSAAPAPTPPPAVPPPTPVHITPQGLGATGAEAQAA
jgi:hypothetical protein